jgi:hypothetical protein
VEGATDATDAATAKDTAAAGLQTEGLRVRRGDCAVVLAARAIVEPGPLSRATAVQPQSRGQALPVFLEEAGANILGRPHHGVCGSKRMFKD